MDVSMGVELSLVSALLVRNASCHWGPKTLDLPGERRCPSENTCEAEAGGRKQ